MKELISIIVPVYNAEEYLERCVESLTAQSYRDLEIILVDDGSRDGSGKLCDALLAKDARIIAIHRENGGPSAARNTGLSCARGAFVTFVDSDDFLDDNAVQVLYSAAREYKADMVCMKKRRVTGEERIHQDPAVYGRARICTSEAFLIGLHTRRQESGACGKLFRRELFDGCGFAEGRLNEDYLLLAAMLMNREVSIVCLPEYFGYYYYHREGSVSRSGVSKASVDAVGNAAEVMKLAQEYRPRVVPYVGAWSAFQAATLLTLMGRGVYSQPGELTDRCFGVIRENRGYFGHLPGVPFIRLICRTGAYLPPFVSKSMILLRGLLRP